MGNAKITIICGHYGCGKTNLALNLALEAAEKGRRVKLADLDLVNPYFRSSDYGPALREKGVELFCPTYAGTTLDLPAVGPQLLQLPEAVCDDVILDAGGDDAGASVLGCVANVAKAKLKFKRAASICCKQQLSIQMQFSFQS